MFAECSPRMIVRHYPALSTLLFIRILCLSTFRSSIHVFSIMTSLMLSLFSTSLVTSLYHCFVGTRLKLFKTKENATLYYDWSRVQATLAKQRQHLSDWLIFRLVSGFCSKRGQKHSIFISGLPKNRALNYCYKGCPSLIPRSIERFPDFFDILIASEKMCDGTRTPARRTCLIAFFRMEEDYDV